jgi:hypothetical protein
MNAKDNETQNRKIKLGKCKHMPTFPYTSLFSLIIYEEKAGTVEPGETSIARHRLGKQDSAATDTQTRIEKLFGTVFSILSMQSCYEEEFS